MSVHYYTKELPASMLLPPCGAGKKSAHTNIFAKRIEDFVKNTVRKKGWQLEVAKGTVLNTPLRALKDAGKLKECESGSPAKQGHSGKSIMGKGAKTRAD